MFSVEKVDMQFSVSADFVAAQVASDILVLALGTGRILRIDLKHSANIEDIDLPKKAADIGVIRKLFLDPTASHLLIATTSGENFYLHAQSRLPRLLSRLRGVIIECVAWSPANPTSSTREILVGTRDGAIYETFIESSNEFYRRDEKYCKVVYKVSNSPVAGILIRSADESSDLRSIFVALSTQLVRIDLRTKRNGGDGSSPIYSGMAEGVPVVYQTFDGQSSVDAILSATPLTTESSGRSDPINQYLAWLSSQGILQAPLDLKLDEAGIVEKRHLTTSAQLGQLTTPDARKARTSNISSLMLSQWHVLYLQGGRLVILNLLSQQKVYDEQVLDPSDLPLSLIADAGTNTHWLFTSREIMEIVITDEERDVWKLMLGRGDYDRALRFASSASERDAVASAQGEMLLDQGKYLEAAEALGKSSSRFEDNCLRFLDAGQAEAIRLYLLGRLMNMSKRLSMQRTMVATWLVELFMSALDEAEIGKNIDVVVDQQTSIAPMQADELNRIRAKYQDFIRRFHLDLDRKTAYEIMKRHARDEDMVFYAELLEDYSFLLTHWSQHEDWTETLCALGKQKKPELFYKYSTVLMQHRSAEFVEILMRQPNLDQQMLIPALLAYDGKVAPAQARVSNLLLLLAETDG